MTFNIASFHSALRAVLCNTQIPPEITACTAHEIYSLELSSSIIFLTCSDRIPINNFSSRLIRNKLKIVCAIHFPLWCCNMKWKIDVSQVNLNDGSWILEDEAQTAFLALALGMDTTIKNSMLRVNFYDPMHSLWIYKLSYSTFYPSYVKREREIGCGERKNVHIRWK